MFQSALLETTDTPISTLEARETTSKSAINLAKDGNIPIRALKAQTHVN
jgi:hypothetical protein